MATGETSYSNKPLAESRGGLRFSRKGGWANGQVGFRGGGGIGSSHAGDVASKVSSENLPRGCGVHEARGVE